MNQFNPDLTGVKLLLSDIDGTLSPWGEPCLYPHVAEWLQKHTEVGAEISLDLITNQGGPACRDHFKNPKYPSLADVESRLAEILKQVPKGTKLYKTYVFISKKDGRVYIPFDIDPESPEANPARRKPSPAMLIEAMKHRGVEPEEVLYVGDRPEDEEAAAAAGVRFHRVKDGFSVS